MTREGREFLASEDTLTTKERVRVLLGVGRAHGITSKEAEEDLAEHHGKVSAALSILHRDGEAARLYWKRAGFSVYVHPDYVNGRPTRPRTYQSKWEEVPDSEDVSPEPSPSDRVAEILDRRAGPQPLRQSVLPFAGPKVTVTRHELHEAVYHAVTTQRPSGMSKTAAHQLAGRAANAALDIITTLEKGTP
jgi:hypothetical protein